MAVAIIGQKSALSLMFGAGIRGGQVVGSTDRLGAKVTSRPVTYQEVMATLYRCLGIDANSDNPR